MGGIGRWYLRGSFVRRGGRRCDELGERRQPARELGARLGQDDRCPGIERGVDARVVREVDEDAPAEDRLDILAAVVLARARVIEDHVDAVHVDAEGFEQEQRRLGAAHGAEIEAGDEQDAIGQLEGLQDALVDVRRRVDDDVLVRLGRRADDGAQRRGGDHLGELRARGGAQDPDLGGAGGENVVEQSGLDVVAVLREVGDREQVVLDVEHPRRVAELEIDVHQRRAAGDTAREGHGEVGRDHRRPGAALAGERDDHGRAAFRGADLAARVRGTTLSRAGASGGTSPAAIRMASRSSGACRPTR